LRLDLQVDGNPFILINNHLKSKREGEEETAGRRLQQSEHLANQTRSILAADPHAAIIVLGDFNDYEDSLVMRKMTVDAGLTNTLTHVPEQERYTYIFDGIPQLLDGILVSEELLRATAGAMIIHTNADYPIGLAADTSRSGLPYYASDHDLPLVLIDLRPGDAADNTIVPDTPAPTAVRPTFTPPAPSIEPPAREFPLWPIPLMTLAAAAIFLLFFWRKSL
jgi:predicted extracellular nuclease